MTKQGRVFPVEVHISLAFVEGNQYVVGLFRDITETLRTEALEKDKAREKISNRAKTVFFSTMRFAFTSFDAVTLFCAVTLFHAITLFRLFIVPFFLVMNSEPLCMGLWVH